MGIPIRSEHFEYALMQTKNRDVEGAASEIVDSNNTVFPLVQAVRQRCSSRFVHQSKHFQPCESPGIFGGLTLRIVEVSGHRDHCFARSEERRVGKECRSRW